MSIIASNYPPIISVHQSNMLHHYHSSGEEETTNEIVTELSLGESSVVLLEDVDARQDGSGVTVDGGGIDSSGVDDGRTGEE